MPRVYKEVFTIQKNGEQSFFHRVGTAFVNKDDSLNVVLFALPTNGELHIRSPKGEDPKLVDQGEGPE